MTFNQFMVGWMAAFVVWNIVERNYGWALADLIALLVNIGCVVWRAQDNG